MDMGRSKSRRDREDTIDILRIAQTHLVEATAQLALSHTHLMARCDRIEERLARVEAILNHVVDLIDRLPGRIGFVKPPEG